jgi:Tfp pilus assembly protein PilO
MEPIFNKPTNSAYTAVIFSFLAISLFGWYAIRPTMQTIFTLKREITDRTGVDIKMEDKISALIEAQANYQNIESNLPLLIQALPTDSEPITAVNQIRGLAEDSGVRMTALSVPPIPLTNPDTGQKKSPVSKLSDFSISASVVGNYANVKNFLTGISNIRRIIQIDDMTIIPQSVVQEASESATADSGTSVQVDLKLKVYYLST